MSLRRGCPRLVRYPEQARGSWGGSGSTVLEEERLPTSPPASVGDWSRGQSNPECK